MQCYNVTTSLSQSNLANLPCILKKALNQSMFLYEVVTNKRTKCTVWFFGFTKLAISNSKPRNAVAATRIPWNHSLHVPQYSAWGSIIASVSLGLIAYQTELNQTAFLPTHSEAPPFDIQFVPALFALQLGSYQ